MKTLCKKSVNGVKAGKGDIDSVIDAIVDHVENNENCEFLRIMEQYSKMDAATMKKFFEYAEKL